MNVVINCNDIHYQYVDPYPAHASWLSATVQLLRKELAEDQSEKRLLNLKFEILKATNDRFVEHWEMSAVPKQNLDMLAVCLGRFTAFSKGSGEAKRALDTRPKNPIPVVPEVVMKTHGSHVESYQEYDGGNLVDAAEWNTDPVSRTGSTTSCAPGSKEIDTSLAAPSEPNYHDLSRFWQCQKPLDLSIASWQEPTVTPWPDGGLQQSEAINMSSDPLDRFTFSTDTETSGGLSSYLEEIFSVPFVG